jgi:hypothetical protein
MIDLYWTGMASTVVPLHNLHLPPGTNIPFANDFFLQDMPQWVKNDKGILGDINYHDRQAILEAKHAFVAEYEAHSIGQPDPVWPKKSRRSIQDSKVEAAVLANLAIWLKQPSTVCFTTVLHALSIIQRVEPRLPLLSLPNDAQSIVDKDDVAKAGKLHAVLCSIQRKNSVWTAMRALWAALTTNEADIRHSLLWIALEALFGDEGNSGEITHKLAERIALFLANTPEDARELYQKAKNSYGKRSVIVHGRFNNDSAIGEFMADTEAIVRTAFRLLLDNPDLLNTFTSKQRNVFLNDLIFSRAASPTSNENI